MSRIDHIITRRQEGARKLRKNQKLRAVLDRITGKVEMRAVPHHTQGDEWWRTRFADLTERLTVDADGDSTRGKNRPVAAKRPKRIQPPRQPATSPEMLPRPEGMTRQTHRRLFRESLKIAGVRSTTR